MTVTYDWDACRTECPTRPEVTEDSSARVVSSRMWSMDLPTVTDLLKVVLPTATFKALDEGISRAVDSGSWFASTYVAQHMYKVAAELQSQGRTVAPLPAWAAPKLVLDIALEDDPSIQELWKRALSRSLDPEDEFTIDKWIVNTLLAMDADAAVLLTCFDGMPLPHPLGGVSQEWLWDRCHCEKGRAHPPDDTRAVIGFQTALDRLISMRCVESSWKTKQGEGSRVFVDTRFDSTIEIPPHEIERVYQLTFSGAGLLDAVLPRE